VHAFRREHLEYSFTRALGFTRVQFERGDAVPEVSRRQPDIAATESRNETPTRFANERSIAAGGLKQARSGEISICFPPYRVQNPPNDFGLRVDSTSTMKGLDRRRQRLRLGLAPRLTIHAAHLRWLRCLRSSQRKKKI